MNATNGMLIAPEAYQGDPEKALLGSLLFRAEKVSDVRAVIQPRSFAATRNRLIYEAIVDLHDRGRTVDIVTVAGELGEQLDACGGHAYLLELLQSVPYAGYAADYAEIVRKRYRERLMQKIIRTCKRTIDDPQATDEDRRKAAQAVVKVFHEPGQQTDRKEIERYKPFPVHCLPGPIHRFVKEGATAIGCDPAYIALPVLAVLASAIGSTRRLQIKRDWRVPPILWTAIVGESGSQKSPAFHAAMEPLKRAQSHAFDEFWEAELEYESRMAMYEKRLGEWRREKHSADDPPVKPEPPQARRMLVSDVTVESLAPILKHNRRGVLVYRDELAGWLGSFDQYRSGGRSGSDRAHWLSLFDGESITVDRKTGSPKTIHVPQAFVSVTGGIQPGVLSRALNHEDRESGLAARILFACPPRKSKRWTEHEIHSDTKAAYAATIERLLALEGTTDPDGNPESVVLQFFPDAKDAWIEFYERHGEEMAGLEGDHAAAWSKLEQIPARLAIVIHCVKDNGEFVTVDTMRKAIELTEWFKHEARRLYAMLGESQEDRDCRNLIELIKRKGGRITPRELTRASRKYQPTEVAERVLIELVVNGKGRWESVKTNGAPRREFVLITDDVDTSP